jgi:putative transposase
MPRIHRELQAQGKSCGRHRVARRLRALGLKTKLKKRFVVTTDSRHHLPVAPNLLGRDFTSTAMNQKWMCDITYIWTTEGWLYLATVIDVYSRAVIGWSLQETMTAELVCNALLMALWRRGFPKDVIVHSDRGSQYCSDSYQQLIKQYQLKCSMSRKGNCWDNAIAESFFHTLKVELIYETHYQTKEETKQNIFQYVEVYYNRQRRHSSIGYQTPYAFENLLQKAA